MKAQTIVQLDGPGLNVVVHAGGRGITTVAKLGRLGAVRANATHQATGANAGLNLPWA